MAGAEIRRLDCRACGRVRTEQVPWARPRARHSRDFEDVVAWLAQHTDKTTIATLLRSSWETIDAIVGRVVGEQLDAARLEGLLRIGVDEVSYRKGHRYLTVVADHDQGGRVVWAAEGKNAAVLEGFYDELGEAGCAALQAISLDLGGAYQKATNTKAPHARQCADPFHVIKLANEAIDKTRRAAWNQARAQPAARRGRGRPRKDAPPPPRDQPRWVKHARWALVKDPDHLKPSQLDILHELRRSGSVPCRCWQLKEGLRDPCRLADPADAPTHLDWWLRWACRCRIPAFVTLARTVRANRDRILAAIELGLSNSRLEGINSKIRLINHRGYGHHSAAALIAMIYLCCGGITVHLPTQR
ncbi:MAG: ISL3 family transposase [Candidatus Nanopelagicales bacterium]